MLAKPSLEPSVATTCGLGIELHAEAAVVVGGLRLAQAGDALGGRIAVGARLGDRLDQLVDDVLRRRHVRIAHAEVDDVGAPRAGGGLEAVDLREDIGRQALDAMEIFDHGTHRHERRLGLGATLGQATAEAALLGLSLAPWPRSPWRPRPGGSGPSRSSGSWSWPAPPCSGALRAACDVGQLGQRHGLRAADADAIAGSARRNQGEPRFATQRHQPLHRPRGTRRRVAPPLCRSLHRV